MNLSVGPMLLQLHLQCFILNNVFVHFIACKCHMLLPYCAHVFLLGQYVVASKAAHMIFSAGGGAVGGKSFCDRALWV